MKGEILHPRTHQMLEVALAHAKAQFETSCGPKDPAHCQVFAGSAWNRGTHVTVIVDRGVCPDHLIGPPSAAVEVWVYDIQGDSPKYLGKSDRPENAALLRDPGDKPAPSSSARPPLKN